MLFPAAMSGKEKREKMAIMETAISSTLSHPNIVQTYTYVVKPLTGELAMQVRVPGFLQKGGEWSGLCHAAGSRQDVLSVAGSFLHSFLRAVCVLNQFCPSCCCGCWR
jgi:hypothetical protein